jgi:hypothetical protein
MELSSLSAFFGFVRAPFRHRADSDAIPIREFRRRKDAGKFRITIDGDRISICDPELGGCGVTINVAQRDHLHEVFRGTWIKSWNEAQATFQTY